jgi:8-oxo-dGTP pyrophosphatase MutT (NUDIX family)
MKIVSSGFVIQNRNGEILLGRDTAIRELKEETGIDISSDHRLNRYISSNPIYTYHLRQKDVHLFFLEDVEGALDNFEFRCDSYWGDTSQPEIDGYKWVKIENLHEYLFPSQRGLAKFLQERNNGK